MFTNDYTNSIFGTLFFQSRLSGSFSSGFYIQGAVSEYFAISTLVEHNGYLRTDSTSSSYTGFGTVASLKPSVIVSRELTRFEFGINAILNTESGDYLRFRKTLPDFGNTDSGKVDVSPHGQTAAGYLEVSGERALGSNWNPFTGTEPHLTIQGGLGYALFDWPYNTNGTGVAKLSFIYALDDTWVSVSGQSMPPLNLGVSVGIGVRTF